MTIREELLKVGFSKEYIDKEAESAYQKRITPRKKFFDTKIGRIISFDIADYLYNSLSLKLYEKQNQKECQIKKKRLEERGFQGDKRNKDEVLQYEQSLDRLPISSVENEDGSFTHTYQDGLRVNIRVTLNGIFDSKSLENIEARNKRLIADYLGLEEESMIKMEYATIDQLIKYNEQLERKKKQHCFLPSNVLTDENRMCKLKRKQEKLMNK